MNMENEFEGKTDAELKEIEAAIYKQVQHFQARHKTVWNEIRRREFDAARKSCPFNIGDRIHVIFHSGKTEEAIYGGLNRHKQPIFSAITKKGEAHQVKCVGSSHNDVLFNDEKYGFVSGLWKKL